MNLPPFSAPVPTKVARALVFVGNILHTIGTNLLSVANEELTGELDKARATNEWLTRVNEDLHRELAGDAPADVDEHQGAAAADEYAQQGYTPCRCGHGSKTHKCRPGQTACEWCGCPRVLADVDEHQGAAAADVGLPLEQIGATSETGERPRPDVDEHQGEELDVPDWLGFGGFPANQSRHSDAPPARL